MQHPLKIASLVIVLATSVAWAHSGVKNPAVKARMAAMGEIGKQTGILGSMVKGETAFDASAARTAAKAIAAHSAQISDLFALQETDPKSEALPEIWVSFEGFSAKAKALETAALAAALAINSESDLRPALAKIGQACSACHRVYRLKK